MAWTQADVDAVRKAIRTGARVVRFGDRTVEYRSQAELFALLQTMEDEVLARTPLRRLRIDSRKGFC